MDGDEVLSACNYNIQSLGDKKYLLKYEKDEKATIEVDGKTVVYNNPNVNIDGAKYQLQIKVK